MTTDARQKSVSVPGLLCLEVPGRARTIDARTLRARAWSREVVL